MEINILYLGAVITVLILLYQRLTRGHDYFHDKPIPSMAVKPILGSTWELYFKRYSFNDFIKMVYNKFEGVKVFGLWDTTTPIYVIRDPELIKKLGVKDFEYFIDRRPMFGDSETSPENVLFARTLTGLRGQKWRDMRATLSPAFTGNKMRTMFSLIVEYSEKMIEIVRAEAAANGGRVDYEMKDFFTRTSNDVIATCAFGLQVESVKDRENEFYMMGKKMVNFTRLSVLIRIFGFRFFPKLMEKLAIDLVDREQIVYFTKIIKDAVSSREAHGIVRPDMIHLLMQAKKGVLKHQQDHSEDGAGFATVEESDVGKVVVNKTMTDSEFNAQCLLFFLAGFDTVSTIFTFIAYELAVNQDVQRRLFEEISQVEKELNGAALSYDRLQQMVYMDMVVSEGLRVWSVPAVDRLCVRDYEFDDGAGLKFTIEKDTCVWFPFYAIHMDPKYYPNPEKFDPERFSHANRANINADIYLPFGIGPRNCIGSRFALMEIKAITYHLLKNFTIETNEKTQVPIRLMKGFLGLAAEKGMHLRLKARS